MPTLKLEDLADIQGGVILPRRNSSPAEEQQAQLRKALKAAQDAGSNRPASFLPEADGAPEGEEYREVWLLQPKDLDEHGDWAGKFLRSVRLPEGTIQAHQLECDDVYLQIKGNSFPSGRVGAIRSDVAPPSNTLEGAVLTGSFARIRLRGQHRGLSRYLRWYLRHPDTVAGLERLARGSSVPFLTLRALRELEIVVPAPHIEKMVVQLDRAVHRVLRKLDEISADRRALRDRLTMQLVRQGGADMEEFGR
jgi:hypothetical protein